MSLWFFMVAPILYADMRERTVYFPEGSTWKNIWDGRIYEGGTAKEVEAPLARIPVFSRCRYTGECLREDFNRVIFENLLLIP